MVKTAESYSVKAVLSAVDNNFSSTMKSCSDTAERLRGTISSGLGFGAMAAIGGLVQVYRVGEVVPNALVGGELDVLAAAVLGGASLNGGKGSVVGTLMGVFLIGVLKNGLNLIGVSNYFMNIVIGVVIVVAITVTHYKKRKETDVGFA